MSSVVSPVSRGMKLSGHHLSTAPEPLLREFASATLGVKRFSAGYMQALRHVLGNQAHAERLGGTLEMNREVDFTTPRTMRTLIDQFTTAGIVHKRRRRTTGNFSESVACYRPPFVRLTSAVAEYERMQRVQEDVDYRRMLTQPKAMQPLPVREEDFPY